MKKISYLIASGALLTCTIVLAAVSGWNLLILAINTVLILGYFIFVWHIMLSSFKLHTNKIKKLKDDLRNLNFEVQVTSSQISSVSESIAVTIDENNEFAKYVYDKVRDMANNNDQVNSSITNTLSEVRSIMELLDKADGITVDMLNKSTISKDTVKLSLEEILQIVQTIDGIHESSNKTLSNMERLQKTSREIAHILETVSNISKQTQLLALNATIESARAGEHGKGFAVVASEIHKLADDTNKSVGDINSLIKGIQNEVESVYSVVRENASRVDDGISATRNIEANLERIDSSFNDVFGMMDSISQLSKQEVQIAQNVGDQIQEVEDVIIQTSKSVDDVCSSVHQQKQNMEDISSLGTRLNEASTCLANLFANETEALETVGNEAPEKARNSLSIIKEELCTRSEIINTKDSGIHEAILNEFMEKYGFVEAAWTNDRKGRFICSIPKAGIANANIREWFKHSIGGEDFISSIYISAITRNPCVTVSSPIKNSSGEIVGVVGIDISIK
ncbi:methyl-accepting chemotaxis protein McpB [Ruminiclostridium hungatei]|uniref:Methyl-accepting chemotaxis protein McpB n=1 Tax=Ruminiclostridium hungatei TaxID=48256 RepID=A0A1V4SFD3_RUMHU|nr:methyl-accepting chemotaxis protein [Ruminiclostridium hungatei]OPX42175.1 methyl-accepting chemotaxis protein McpB [Ruminiclostridium hungatei]